MAGFRNLRKELEGYFHRRLTIMGYRNFLREEHGGPVATEYVVFVAAIGIIMAVGVFALYNGMEAVFNAWAGYFAAPTP